MPRFCSRPRGTEFLLWKTGEYSLIMCCFSVKRMGITKHPVHCVSNVFLLFLVKSMSYTGAMVKGVGVHPNHPGSCPRLVHLFFL
jgi:hypothetical protein